MRSRSFAAATLLAAACLAPASAVGPRSESFDPFSPRPGQRGRKQRDDVSVETQRERIRRAEAKRQQRAAKRLSRAATAPATPAGGEG